MVHNKRINNFSNLIIKLNNGKEPLTTWFECKALVKSMIDTSKTTLNWVASKVYAKSKGVNLKKNQKYRVSALKKLKWLQENKTKKTP